MPRRSSQLAVEAGARPEGDGPGAEYKKVWFALARRYWASVVLVPASPRGSVAELARGLAEVGKRLREEPVTAIVAEALDYDGAAKLAQAVGATGAVSKARPVATPLQLIVAVQPVVVEPLGVAVAHAADAAIVCIEMGWTRLEDVRRTVEVIGRERVAGTIVLR